jgi:hypothetical protein
MEFLTDEQMAQVEKTGQLPDAMSDEEMAALEAQETAPANPFDKFQEALPNWVKTAGSMLAAKQAGLANAVTLGYGDLGDLPVVGKGFEQAKKESPVSYAYGNMQGAVGPGAAMGVATAAVAPARMASSVPGRIAINAAQGAIEGGLRNPREGENRLTNAMTGGRDAALMGTALEGAAGATRVGGKLAQWLGGKLGGVTKPEAVAFKRSPETADDLARKLREDPKGLSEEVQKRIGGGIEETFDRVSEPALQKVGRAVVHKNVRVRPDQFRGTAAEPEIQRSWDLRHPPRHAAYTEVTPFEVQATPVRTRIMKAGPIQETRAAQPPVQMQPIETRMHFGEPVEQTYFNGRNPYDPASVPVESVDRSIEKAGGLVTLKPRVPAVRNSPVGSRVVKDGPVATLEKGYLRGQQNFIETAQTPMSETISLHGPQALRAKRAAQKAAAHKNALSPLGYDPASEADAAAAGRFKLGLEGAAPDVIEANKTLEEAARYSGMAKARFSNNPAGILTDSESVGSVPTRQMRQFLDQHGNAGLEDMANSLAAGRALGPQGKEGLWDAVTRVGARGLLRGSAKADSAEQAMRDMKIRALLQGELAAEKKDKK